jgi:hypothetical protein
MTSTDSAEEDGGTTYVAYERALAEAWNQNLQQSLVTQGYEHWHDGITPAEAGEYLGISSGAASFQLKRCNDVGIMTRKYLTEGGHRVVVYMFAPEYGGRHENPPAHTHERTLMQVKAV